TGSRPEIPPGDCQGTLTGERSISCCFVLLCIEACLHSKTHTSQLVKQHTINPLITPDFNPFLPSVIVQSQCFLLALITVLVSLGMSVAVSQFPPVSECLPQSRY
ncbi:unnamed protein product, partial [Staurois parvus]